MRKLRSCILLFVVLASTVHAQLTGSARGLQDPLTWEPMHDMIRERLAVSAQGYDDEYDYYGWWHDTYFGLMDSDGLPDITIPIRTSGNPNVKSAGNMRISYRSSGFGTVTGTSLQPNITDPSSPGYFPLENVPIQWLILEGNRTIIDEIYDYDGWIGPPEDGFSSGPVTSIGDYFTDLKTLGTGVSSDFYLRRLPYETTNAPVYRIYADLGPARTPYDTYFSGSLSLSGFEFSYPADLVSYSGDSVWGGSPGTREGIELGGGFYLTLGVFRYVIINTGWAMVRALGSVYIWDSAEDWFFDPDTGRTITQEGSVTVYSDYIVTDDASLGALGSARVYSSGSSADQTLYLYTESGGVYTYTYGIPPRSDIEMLPVSIDAGNKVEYASENWRLSDTDGLEFRCALNGTWESITSVGGTLTPLTRPFGDHVEFKLLLPDGSSTASGVPDVVTGDEITCALPKYYISGIPTYNGTAILHIPIGGGLESETAFYFHPHLVSSQMFALQGNYSPGPVYPGYNLRIPMDNYKCSVQEVDGDTADTFLKGIYYTDSDYIGKWMYEDQSYILDQLTAAEYEIASDGTVFDNPAFRPFLCTTEARYTETSIQVGRARFKVWINVTGGAAGNYEPTFWPSEIDRFDPISVSEWTEVSASTYDRIGGGGTLYTDNNWYDYYDPDPDKSPDYIAELDGGGHTFSGGIDGEYDSGVLSNPAGPDGFNVAGLANVHINKYPRSYSSRVTVMAYRPGPYGNYYSAAILARMPSTGAWEAWHHNNGRYYNQFIPGPCPYLTTLYDNDLGVDVWAILDPSEEISCYATNGAPSGIISMEAPDLVFSSSDSSVLSPVGVIPDATYSLEDSPVSATLDYLSSPQITTAELVNVDIPFYLKSVTGPSDVEDFYEPVGDGYGSEGVTEYYVEEVAQDTVGPYQLLDGIDIALFYALPEIRLTNYVASTNTAVRSITVEWDAYNPVTGPGVIGPYLKIHGIGWGMPTYIPINTPPGEAGSYTFEVPLMAESTVIVFVRFIRNILDSGFMSLSYQEEFASATLYNTSTTSAPFRPDAPVIDATLTLDKPGTSPYYVASATVAVGGADPYDYQVNYNGMDFPVGVPFPFVAGVSDVVVSRLIADPGSPTMRWYTPMVTLNPSEEELESLYFPSTNPHPVLPPGTYYGNALPIRNIAGNYIFANDVNLGSGYITYYVTADPAPFSLDIIPKQEDTVRAQAQGIASTNAYFPTLYLYGENAYSFTNSTMIASGPSAQFIGNKMAHNDISLPGSFEMYSTYTPGDWFTTEPDVIASAEVVPFVYVHDEPNKLIGTYSPLVDTSPITGDYVIEQGYWYLDEDAASGTYTPVYPAEGNPDISVLSHELPTLSGNVFNFAKQALPARQVVAPVPLTDIELSLESSDVTVGYFSNGPDGMALDGGIIGRPDGGMELQVIDHDPSDPNFGVDRSRLGVRVTTAAEIRRPPDYNDGERQTFWEYEDAHLGSYVGAVRALEGVGNSFSMQTNHVNTYINVNEDVRERTEVYFSESESAVTIQWHVDLIEDSSWPYSVALASPVFRLGGRQAPPTATPWIIFYQDNEGDLGIAPGSSFDLSEYGKLAATYRVERLGAILGTYNSFWNAAIGDGVADYAEDAGWVYGPVRTIGGVEYGNISFFVTFESFVGLDYATSPWSFPVDTDLTHMNTFSIRGYAPEYELEYGTGQSWYPRIYVDFNMTGASKPTGYDDAISPSEFNP